MCSSDDHPPYEKPIPKPPAIHVVSGPRREVDIDAHGTDWREALGDALHTAVHPKHPWSGCNDPDRVYESWMPRFISSLRESGYRVVPS